MAEGFSTVAGVASLIDVALRGCNMLYDSIRYLNNEPELSEQLQRTVQSVQSILRSLDEFITIYRQQQVSAGLSNFLPEAVNYEIISIKADLDALASSLPNPNSKSQLRRRLKWVIDRKQVAEAIQRLVGHQITLLLALQSFAQRKDVSFHKDLSQKLDQILQHHESSAQNLTRGLDSFRTELHKEAKLINQQLGKSLSAQGNLDTKLKNLQETIIAEQRLANNKLDVVKDSFRQLEAGGVCQQPSLRSDTVLAVSSEDMLARIFRAELRRVIMPTVEKCFQRFRTNSDIQLVETRRKIDEMTERLESKLGEDVHGCGIPTNDTLSKVGSTLTHDDERLTVAAPGNLEIRMMGVPKSQNGSKDRQVKQWRRSWTHHWAIGVLWVTISTNSLSRKPLAECYVGEAPSSNKTYRMTIEFLPSQTLVQLRGLSLSIINTPDQRGYYQICPLISTFAVVPPDAEVMIFASSNDVEGLRNLFERRLAAPSDRDTYHGMTPLMIAAAAGALETCHLLLNEGADPLAVDDFGSNSLDWTSFCFVKNATERKFDYRRHVLVLESIVQADNYTLEDSRLAWVLINMWLRMIAIREGVVEWPLHLYLSYWQRLIELGSSLGYNLWDEGGMLLFSWISMMRACEVKLSRNTIGEMLRTISSVGVEFGEKPLYGWHALHWEFFFFKKNNSTETSFHNSFEIATVLLQHGADPCALTNNGNSVFDVADLQDCTSIFVNALEEAGYDIEEVRRETERRQWFFKNPGHGFAESTAVDDAQLAPPSTKGLVARRAVRGDRLEN